MSENTTLDEYGVDFGEYGQETLPPSRMSMSVGVLGATVYVTRMPGFYGECDSIVVSPEDGLIPRWIDEQLIPEEDRQ